MHHTFTKRPPVDPETTLAKAAQVSRLLKLFVPDPDHRRQIVVAMAEYSDMLIRTVPLPELSTDSNVHAHVADSVPSGK